MRKTRYNDKQIIKILKDSENGRPIKEICSEHNISQATYYNWRSKFKNIVSFDIKTISELQEENRKLKEMYINISLRNKELNELIEKQQYNT